MDFLGKCSDIMDQRNSLLVENSKPKGACLDIDQCNGANAFEVCKKLLTIQTP